MNRLIYRKETRLTQNMKDVDYATSFIGNSHIKGMENKFIKDSLSTINFSRKQLKEFLKRKK